MNLIFWDAEFCIETDSFTEEIKKRNTTKEDYIIYLLVRLHQKVNTLLGGYFI